MEFDALFLLTLGGVLLVGLVTSALGRRTFLPRVTLLLLFGVLIGKQGLDIIPDIFTDLFEIIAQMALLMVGFLIGGKLTLGSLRQSMGHILWISISAVIFTAVVVTLGLMLVGVSKEIAILLGCIATATAPAAILDVMMESRSEGPFKDLLLSIVALDDAWALVLFAVGIALVLTMNGHAGDNTPVLMALQDIMGAVILGVVIGYPAAKLSGRLKPGQPMMSEALGIVFVCGGLALWLHVSFLISVMVMGMMVANCAKHHERPFHAIEGIEEQFLLIFFVLAGASLELASAADLGLVVFVFIVCRIIGKILGARMGGELSGADRLTKKWMGVALLPQAGVSIGMALVASGYFPEYRQTLLSVVISATVFFEIVGPVFTRMALQKANRNG